ncbi:MAG: SagB/ThcOx family dehydrogenase [Thermodesulfobacteriota bacterium]|nr:SagB/ThcOx family dehydrogenase [Thermodesulfobacteriota bacterium]
MSGFLTRREILSRFINGLIVFSSYAFFPLRKVEAGRPGNDIRKGGPMDLQQPRKQGDISLENAINNRRTIRSFASKKLTGEQFSQLLWAAQGITDGKGFKRSAPSGGALYPMNIYAVVGENLIEGMKAGIYHYEPHGHTISLIITGDLRKEVARAALSQMWMAKPPLTLVITAEYGRITSKYGQRGVRYAMIEAGHIGQNIFLQAEALGLRAGIVGAFHDRDVIRVMKIPSIHEPLLIMPVGYKR